MEGYTKIGRIRPVFQGEWSSAKEYSVLDMVRSANGAVTYVAAQNVPAGTALTDSKYWQAMVDMRSAYDQIAALQKKVDGISVTGGSGIENTVSGDVIAVNDSLDAPLRGLKLFGKTTQNGTPTPDAPVELENAGNDGNITATIAGGDISQSITLSTPNGLPGIPVSTGGNYTDGSGQQWVCDEIDFGRGVYVRRVGRVAGSKFTWASGSKRWQCTVSDPRSDALETNIYYPILCNAAVFSTSSAAGTCRPGYGTNAGSMVVYLPEDFDISEMVLYYQCEPVETPLSTEELAAYAALHTFKPITTVTNDSGAGMQIGYSADTKAYIDNKFAELAAVLAAKA